MLRRSVCTVFHYIRDDGIISGRSVRLGQSKGYYVQPRMVGFKLLKHLKC